MNENNIKVSIWCTCYNHEKYIAKCLDGFVNQKTNFKYEVIIHDDASTDNSIKIIKEYAEKYHEIIKPIFQKENQYSKGVNLMKDFFLPKINGKYVAFCEGDDFWCNENKLQIQYDIMEKFDECELCFHPTEIIDENNNSLNRYFPPIENIPQLKNVNGFLPQEMALRFILHANCKIHISSFLLKSKKFKQYVNEIPDFSKSLFNIGIGDGPLAAYFISLGKIFYIGFQLSCYRNSHPGSYTYEMMKKMKDNQQISINMIKAWQDMYIKYDEFTDHKFKNILIDENMIFNYKV